MTGMMVTVLLLSKRKTWGLKDVKRGHKWTFSKKRFQCSEKKKVYLHDRYCQQKSKAYNLILNLRRKESGKTKKVAYENYLRFHCYLKYKTILKPELKHKYEAVLKPGLKQKYETVLKPELKQKYEAILKPELKHKYETILKPELKQKYGAILKPELKHK
ncbi:hypothetical protein LOTGIDRAFT_157197 [Lottia gigantea]|uniref:Uncharacterized protein n=1 Tax=Lottia gigantea TaxID=225164 RepID=V4B3T2_LOTGI|nr:hypothetical protein LOTGIDRAFT_157197 [Lottia gigantea]ESP02056.1 hypothetical protein LOTGIDRAFT_157197 [Lottia gigantea]